jgi:hypothetical protein
VTLSAERAMGAVMMPWPAAKVARAKVENYECIIVEFVLHQSKLMER